LILGDNLDENYCTNINFEVHSDSIDRLTVSGSYQLNFLNVYSDGGNVTTIDINDKMVFAGEKTGSSSQIEIIDFTDHFNPQELFQISTPSPVNHLVYHDGYLYSAMGESGLGIYRFMREEQTPVINSISVADNKAKVGWTFSDALNSDITGYEIHMDTTDTFSDPWIYTSLVRSITIPISQNGTYYFRVRALYDGKTPGGWSQIASSQITIQANKVSVTEIQYITDTITQNITSTKFQGTLLQNFTSTLTVTTTKPPINNSTENNATSPIMLVNLLILVTLYKKKRKYNE